MKLFKRVQAENVHGIYIYSPPMLPTTVDAIHKSIFTLIGADATDAVKIEALKTLVALVNPIHNYEIRDCDIRIGV